MKRLTTVLLMALVSLSVLTPASAQDSKIRVEIKDGKVLVNGSEVETDGSDQIVIETEDGESVTVFFSEDGRSVWVGDDGEHRASGNGFIHMDNGRFQVNMDTAKHLKEMMERVGPNGNLLMRDGGEGTAFFWGDDEDGPTVFEREHLFPPAMTGREEMRFRVEHMALERKLNQAARKLRMADADEKAELERELDALLEEAFDAKLANQRAEAERLQERLEELRSRLNQRAEARQDIIERRKRQLMGERDVLDW